MSIKINPSLAAADLSDLKNQIKMIEDGGADRIHFDVMDGHFVPELTIGLPILRATHKVTKLPIDVHIMVSNPDDVFKDYLDAGAETIIFHPEIARHAHRICQVTREMGKKAGVALSPAIHWNSIEFLLPYLDHVVIMTVSPGFSRQPHLSEIHYKIREFYNFSKSKNWNGILEIDGGVNEKNIEVLAEYGANYFVSGGNIFDAKEGVAAKIKQLRQLAENGLKKRK